MVRARPAFFILWLMMRWLPSHLVRSVRSHRRPTHVLFCMVDHFEPGTGGVDVDTERARMARLLTRYPQLADAHADAEGRPPCRTWFFPPHYHRNGNLRDLVSLCQAGYGEIELHLHHGETEPDSSDSLRRTIELCLRDYRRFGIFGSEEDQIRYGFIHGQFGLNNSTPGCCGVNDELAILEATGCYADFTMPSCGSSNPSQINSIYYPDVGRHQPRGFSRGVPVKVGSGPRPGLMMIQGPFRPIWVEGRLTCGDGIGNARPPSARLIDAWVGVQVHVLGRPEWVVVKVHTHGAVDEPTVLGEAMEQTFAYLENAYNDGSRFVLHYVTARELYNVVRAAEAGMTGDPGEYRDYQVAAPRYDSTVAITEGSPELLDAVYKTCPR